MQCIDNNKKWTRASLEETYDWKRMHGIRGEGHIPPNTTKYDHITFTSKQIKFTWY